MNGRFIYANSNGQYLFYLLFGGWSISSDYNSMAVHETINSAEYCPEAIGSDSTFKEWSGTAWTGRVSVVCRVPVVTQGCDSFALSGANAEHESLMDTYQQTDTRTPDGRWVYNIRTVTSTTSMHQPPPAFALFGLLDRLTSLPGVGFSWSQTQCILSLTTRTTYMNKW